MTHSRVPQALAIAATVGAGCALITVHPAYGARKPVPGGPVERLRGELTRATTSLGANFPGQRGYRYTAVTSALEKVAQLPRHKPTLRREIAAAKQELKALVRSTLLHVRLVTKRSADPHRILAEGGALVLGLCRDIDAMTAVAPAVPKPKAGGTRGSSPKGRPNHTRTEETGTDELPEARARLVAAWETAWTTKGADLLDTVRRKHGGHQPLDRDEASALAATLHALGMLKEPKPATTELKGRLEELSEGLKLK